MARPRFDETDEELDARRGRPLRVILYGFLAVFLACCGAVLYPVWQSARPMPARGYAMQSMKQCGLAIQMYASDNDDRFPIAEIWMDATDQYMKDETPYHSLALVPADPKRGDPYGIAFRRSLSSASVDEIDNLDHVALVFDSANLYRNASSELDLLPNPGRYAGKNVVGFVDGHAKMIPANGFTVR